MAKQTFIIKASASAVRVDNKYILCAYSPRLYATENDFAVIQFPSKKEMREAFKDIAREGMDGAMYKDNATDAVYIRINAKGYGNKAEDYMFLASMITPHCYC